MTDRKSSQPPEAAPSRKFPTKQSFDWGPSAYDRRHRLVLAYIWDLPYIHGNTFARVLTKGFEFSGIATIETGTPNTSMTARTSIWTAAETIGQSWATPRLPNTSIGIDGTILGLNAVPGTYYDLGPVRLRSGAMHPDEPERLPVGHSGLRHSIRHTWPQIHSSDPVKCTGTPACRNSSTCHSASSNSRR